MDAFVEALSANIGAALRGAPLVGAPDVQYDVECGRVTVAALAQPGADADSVEEALQAVVDACVWLTGNRVVGGATVELLRCDDPRGDWCAGDVVDVDPCMLGGEGEVSVRRARMSDGAEYCGSGALQCVGGDGDGAADAMASALARL